CSSARSRGLETVARMEPEARVDRSTRGIVRRDGDSHRVGARSDQVLEAELARVVEVAIAVPVEPRRQEAGGAVETANSRREVHGGARNPVLALSAHHAIIHIGVWWGAFIRDTRTEPECMVGRVP